MPELRFGDDVEESLASPGRAEPAEDRDTGRLGASHGGAASGTMGAGNQQILMLM